MRLTIFILLNSNFHSLVLNANNSESSNEDYKYLIINNQTIIYYIDQYGTDF